MIPLLAAILIECDADGRRRRQDTFWSWTDLLLFLVLGLPAFVAVFWLVALSMKPLTHNKALLVMIPQFCGTGCECCRRSRCCSGGSTTVRLLAAPCICRSWPRYVGPSLVDGACGCNRRTA